MGQSGSVNLYLLNMGLSSLPNSSRVKVRHIFFNNLRDLVPGVLEVKRKNFNKLILLFLGKAR